MSEYISPVSETTAPAAKRRSTGTSDALQYYWSASAGERSSSFSSSLGISPIQTSPRPGALDSPYTLSPHPPLPETKSHVSLRELVEQEAEHERLRGGFPASYDDSNSVFLSTGPRNIDMATSVGASNRHIHLVSYSSDGMSAPSSEPPSAPSSQNHVPPSPASSHSADSEYSLIEEEAPAAIPQPLPPIAALRQSRVNAANRRGVVDTDGQLGVLLDPSFEEWAHQRSWETASTPVSPPIVSPRSPQEPWRTPRQGDVERVHTSPTIWSAKSSSSHGSDTTPRNSGFPAAIGSRHGSGKADKTPIAGGMMFVAPPDVSLDDLQRDISNLGLEARGARGGSRVGLSVNSAVALSRALDEPDTPHSAPATKTSFDNLDINDRTRPASLLPPTTTPLGTPIQMVNRQLDVPTPRSSPALSVRRSPEPPPKSELRRLTPTPPPKAMVTSPDEISPGEKHTPPLPTIINTPHTPEPPKRATTVPIAASIQRSGSPRARSTSPPQPISKSGTPEPISKSGTLQDPANMLGGAIDDSGRADSGDASSSIGESNKEHGDQPLVLQNLPPRSTSTGTHEPVPSLSPNNGPFHMSHHRRPSGSHGATGLGIVSGTMAVAASTKGNVSRHVRKASSILSLRSSNYSLTSPTAATFNTAPQSLPAAVLFGNIKALKTSGERARAYSRSISELGRADSGLRELCSNIHYRSGSLSRSRQGAPVIGLGVPPSLNPSTMRNVSTGSEFPMRADAYSAREIAVRNLEPTDEPTALPPNLPFPALQLQNVAVKASGSMQSLASVASSRRPGFLAAFGRLKKDKENTTLGPPTGSLLALNQTASSSKKDLRASTNSGSRRNSFDSSDNRIQPAFPMPRGPRGPENAGLRSSLEVPSRQTSQTPPRSSLDSSLNSSRSGLTGPRPPHSNGTTPSPSPLGNSSNGDSSGNGKLNELNEDDVRQFSDLIPSAERAVARAYLQRYGEMHFAVTAYLEDEKQGSLMRA